MKLALLLLIIGGWFYLRRKFKKRMGLLFPGLTGSWES